MFESGSNPHQEQQQQQSQRCPSTIEITKKIESPPKQKIHLYDSQSGLPVSIYLEKNNTLNLENVKHFYPTATTVKIIFPGEKYPDVFPCENGQIRSPVNNWPDGIYEPVLPSYTIQPLTQLIPSHVRGYAPCQLVNLYKPNLYMDAELLIDCDSSIDLILPAKQIEKLQLRKDTGGVSARGFNNHITVLSKYEDVKILVHLKHPTTGHISIKSAIISVFERLPVLTADISTQCSEDAAPDEPITTSLPLFSPQLHLAMTTSTTSVDDNPDNVPILKLSPLKHSFQPDDQYGILGYPPMTKLNIGVHFGGNYIYGIGRLMEFISTISLSKTN